MDAGKAVKGRAPVVVQAGYNGSLKEVTTRTVRSGQIQDGFVRLQP